ncbi:hypothetical protein HDU85_000370 [Gaertneriomyces sp. JEL0708]|nr:hypothetical protein HDU85_000370 [Gaertneriomyces sp. JEL0708]
MLSASPEELQVRRFLLRLEAAASKFAARDGSTPSQVENLELVKYRSNLAHLARLIEQLESNDECDESSLIEIRQRLEQLEDHLNEEKLVSSVARTVSSLRNLSALPSTAFHSESRAAAEQMLKVQRSAEEDMRHELLGSAASQPLMNLHEPPILESHTLEEAREELLSSPQRDVRKRTTYHHDASESPSLRPSVVQDDPQLLKEERELQEAMTDDLARMAAQLKMSSLALREGLKRDEKVLNDTAETLYANVSRLTSEGTRLSTLNVASRKTTWMIWLTVLLVCVLFVFTFIIMRVFKPRPALSTPPLAHSHEEGWLW